VNASFKNRVHEAGAAHLAAQMKSLQMQMDQMRMDLGSETKSSAGDKHETGRAMIQLEQERLGSQITLLKKQLDGWGRIPSETKERITLGALAKINGQWFYFSSAIGKMTVDEREITCLGLTSPLGQALLGMPAQGSIQFRDQLWRIEEVL